MRDLLIVSYHFVPVYNVAVKQIAKYCKYLPEFGWRPVVLTNDWSAGPGPDAARWGLSVEPDRASEFPPIGEVHAVTHGPRDNALYRLHKALSARSSAGGPLRRLAFGSLRRPLSLAWPLFGDYPDGAAGWMAAAAQEGLRLARRGSVAAILSQSPPEVNHVVASRIARRTGLPWFPFMGDLFHSYEGVGDMHGGGLRGAVTRRLQRHWLRPARRAFAVSPRMVRELAATYRLPGDVVVVGFDPAEFEPPLPPRGGKLRIAHVGSLYLGDQRPELFFDALDAFLLAHPQAFADVEVRLVGSRADAGLRGLLSDRRCAPLVSVESKVTSSEAVKIQRESDVLLLFDLTTPRGAGGTLSYPSKVFEYLGARRPILSLPGDGDWVDHIIESTGAGIVARTPVDAAALLARWYAEWRARGHVAWTGDANMTYRYAHRAQAERIALVLDRSLDVSGTRTASAE